MEREEEALIPLVRQRNFKRKDPKNISTTTSSRASSTSTTVTGFEQTIQVTSNHGNKDKKKSRRLDKHIKNMFSVKEDNSRQIYILIGIEVIQRSVTKERFFIPISKVVIFLICSVLLYWCYHHPAWFHYQVCIKSIAWSLYNMTSNYPRIQRIILTSSCLQATRVFANLGQVESQHRLGEEIVSKMIAHNCNDEVYSGQKLLNGHGVAMDETGAMEWFRLTIIVPSVPVSPIIVIIREASRGGHHEASYNLAVGHLNGLDTGLEEGEHEDLLRHALRGGVEGAEAVLDHVCRSGQCLGDDEDFLY